MQPRVNRRTVRNTVSAGVLALAGTVAPVAAHGAPPTTASAPARARPAVVLESYVGQRPENAAAIMAPVLDELDARGFIATPQAVLQRLGGLAPRPGAVDTATAAELIEPADTGYAAYARGRFAEAEAVLSVALDRIHHNPALLVLDTHNLDATFRILVALALSQAKRGNTGGSVATMIELIRTFHNHPITRADYGPDAEQFYRAVARQVQAMGRGQLAIAVDNDQAVIFVDGQIRGLGRAALTDLVPGVYRVFMQPPGSVGRQYEVEVNANELSELRVDWELDATLRMTEPWVGFLFATEAERHRQAQFAGELARRWGQPIAVVGMAAQQGTVGLTASLYDSAGDVVRCAAISLDGADDHRLRSLGRFLADGTGGDGVIVVRDTTRVGSAATHGSPGSPGSPGSSGSSGSPGSLGSPGSPPGLMPGLLVGAGAAAFVAGGVLYAIDQDPGPDPAATYRNTAPAGVVVGAVGLAAVGMGLWLWRTRARSTVPIIAISSRGGFVGWAGAL